MLQQQPDAEQKQTKQGKTALRRFELKYRRDIDSWCLSEILFPCHLPPTIRVPLFHIHRVDILFIIADVVRIRVFFKGLSIRDNIFNFSDLFIGIPLKELLPFRSLIAVYDPGLTT